MAMMANDLIPTNFKTAQNSKRKHALNNQNQAMVKKWFHNSN